MAHRRTWLCPDAGDRDRLLDMDRRLRRGRAIAMAFLFVALVGCIPWLGAWPVAVLVGAAITFRLLEVRIDKSHTPEWPIAATWLISVAAIGASIVLTGGATSPAKSWLLIPAVTLPARFGKRGLYAGAVITMVVLAIVTVGVDTQTVADEPQLFWFPAALIAATLALSMALRSSEIQHRTEAVIDPLTGMLNRKALETRSAELAEQSRVSGQPVGLILCDVDHFKAVNDTHGHAMGDAVLADVAYRIRKELRAYDLAYRLGGEEFVVLVPGASAQTASELAERLRTAIAEESVEGVEVTASFGVAVHAGRGLDMKRLLEACDEALYRAKASGRNCVRTPEDPAFAAMG